MTALEKMTGHPRLYRRNATYWHRAAIPRDIAATYPKSEETFSLRTKDYHEAIRRVRIAAVEVDERFAEHRRREKAPVLDALSEDQLSHIYKTYYRYLLEEDEGVRTDGFSGYTAAKTFEAAQELNETLAAATRHSYARGELDDFHLGEAEEVLTWDGIDIKLSPTSPSWRQLARTLQEASLEAAEAIAARYQGKVIKTPSEAPEKPLSSPTGPRLGELFAQRKSEASRTNSWAPKLLDDYQAWMDLFITLKGDRPILSYNKSDARDFKKLLMGLPSNRSKLRQTKGLSALDAVKVAKAEGLPTLTVSTINKALTRMQATWRWADKQLDENIPDIFGPMKLAAANSARDEADPFSPDQLRLIFSSPLFTGCKSERFRTQKGDTDMSGTSWYWLPLLGLWTGARLNELCQLRVDDVHQDGEIPFLELHEGDDTQRIKGGRGRIVPIHPELAKLGFLEYASAQRDSMCERLFPALKVDQKGYYSGQPSKDFSAYLEKIGAKTAKTSFHSFRHNFKDACRNAGIHPDLNDILLGHSLPGMAGRYGSGTVLTSRLYDEVRKIEHTDLSLAHVRGFTP